MGSVTFNHSIIGVLIEQTSLALTDPLLGSIGRYPSLSRGLDLLGNNQLTLSDDLRTLTVLLHAVSH